MTTVRKALIGLCIAGTSLGAFAQSAVQQNQQHAADAARSATRHGKAPADPVSADRMAAMDQHMKAMQAMHEKMTSSKSPEERQTLMPEQMKMMRDGMTMMKQMHGMAGMGEMQSSEGLKSNMADRQQIMEKRVDMMEAMMQMMIDRMSVKPAE